MCGNWQEDAAKEPEPDFTSTSRLDQSSLRHRSHLNQKRALDNVGVCQPPPQNKICVEIDKKVQQRSQNQISTSRLDQSSLQPRSQLNQKRALDNSGVDQSPPHKKQRLAIKDQQLEPGSFKQMCYLCSIFIHFCNVLNI